MTASTPDLQHLHSGVVGLEGHKQRRLALEQQHHQQAQRGHGRVLHSEDWCSLHAVIRQSLRLLGLHGRGQHNARQIRLREHRFVFADLPPAFEGFRILHLSDLHLDMDAAACVAIIKRVAGLEYDLCVMTGDYRASTFGSCEPAMQCMAELRRHLRGDVFAVFGNHDSIDMLPDMEAMGIQVLINAGLRLSRSGQSVGLAGIDDAHFFKLHDLASAYAAVAQEPVKILLSHTPEVFAEAAAAGFDAFLCGHTHGGQICLPGGIALTLEARCPRSLGKGAWRFQGMQGYTSVGAGTSIVNVRFNCPPEVTLHTLTRA